MSSEAVKILNLILSDIFCRFHCPKSGFPVTQLAYGASNHRYSWIHYTLGNLVCFGKRGLYPSEAADADFHFKATYTGG